MRKAREYHGMTMKSLLMIAVTAASLFGVSVSEARINETLDEAITRYGKVTSEDDFNGEHWYHFNKNGYAIAAVLKDGKITKIEYSRPVGKEFVTSLDDEEVKSFLNANDSSKWEMHRKFLSKSGVDWETDHLMSFYNDGTDNWTAKFGGSASSYPKNKIRWSLRITSNELVKEIEAAEAKAEAANLKGF